MVPRPLIFAAFAVALAATAPAGAQTASAKPLRLVGEAATAADPAPKDFAIDAMVTPGDSEATATITGRFAATAAPAASGEVTGTCVEIHCALTADLDGSKFILTGDFAALAGPVQSHFTFKDSDGKIIQTGAAAVSPLAGPLAGLGILAEPGAITQAQFDELLVWGHATVSTGSPPGDDPPTGFQREALATWQNGKGRLATGLIFAADLAELAVDEATERKAAGWTQVTAASGWRAGYPAALLPTASHGPGAEQRFASADGKAVLAVGFDPPLSSADFDAFVEKITADREGRDQVSLTRVNNDMEMRYREGGVITVAAWHNREAGMARLVFTYPDAASDRYSPYETILTRALAETP